MKKKLFSLTLILSFLNFYSQSWNTTGNSGTNPTINYVGTSDNSDLTIRTNNVEQMRVSTSGEVAIGGSPSPKIKMKVYGRTQIKSNTDGDVLGVLNDAENLSSGMDLLFLRYGKYQPSNPGVIMVSGMTTPTKYESFFQLRANGKLALGTANFQNCSDCAEYRLFVKDGIRTEKIKIDIASTNAWADHVLQKDYQLPTLKEVEDHIATKGHLPNIPSAEEMMKNGLDIAKMDAKLLEKIEELTLYTIEQNKLHKEQAALLQKQIEVNKQLEIRIYQLEKNK